MRWSLSWRSWSSSASSAAIRSSALRMAFAELPNETGGAVLARRGRATVIMLDRRLTQSEREAALAHELLHLERGSTSHCRNIRGALSVEVVREENRIQREVALRLVPLDELGPMVDRLADLGHGVTALEVADEFDVPPVVASQALTELAALRARHTTA